MARIRTIKPSFFTSETISRLTVEQRLTFIGLWTHVDDEGRCVDNARLVKAAIWPLDDRTGADVEGDLGALSECSLITRYTVSGKRYIVVNGFREHQVINRKTRSTLPGPDQATPPAEEAQVNQPATSTNTQADTSSDTRRSEDSRSTHTRKGREGKGKEKTITSEKGPREDVERLCTRLADRIEANGCRRPDVGAKWRDSARLMLDRDKLTEDQVARAIDWSTNDEFWRQNILSMPTLRAKYDQLRMSASSRNGRASPGRRDEPNTSPSLKLFDPEDH